MQTNNQEIHAYRYDFLHPEIEELWEKEKQKHQNCCDSFCKQTVKMATRSDVTCSPQKPGLSEQQLVTCTRQPELAAEHQHFPTAALSSSSSSYYNDQSAVYLNRMIYGNSGGIHDHPSILGPLLRSGREANHPYPTYQPSYTSNFAPLDTSQMKLRTVRSDSSGNQFVCGICGREFGMRCRLIAHVRKHTGEKPFACSECARAFSDQGNLQRHRYTHSTLPRFHCTTCGKYFRQASCLSNHRRFHCSGATGRPCMFCKRTFRSSSSLQIHLRFKHRDDAAAAVVATAAAAVSGNSFSPPHPLTVPMVTGDLDASPKAIGEASTSLDCGETKRQTEAAGRRTAKWRRKTRLPKQVPPSEPSFPVPLSSLTKKNDVSNENEETSSTKDIANFKVIAEAIFSTDSSGLTPSSSSHLHRSRACNFTCPSCPRRFAFQCRLAAHLRCHTNQRPFICPNCGRSFTQRGYLMRHAAVHKLDRPFTCDVCQRAYKHYGSLVNHKRTHSSQLETDVGCSNDEEEDDVGDGGEAEEGEICLRMQKAKQKKKLNKKSADRPDIDLNSIPIGPEPRPFLQQYFNNSLSNLAISSPLWSHNQHNNNNNNSFMLLDPPSTNMSSIGYRPTYHSVFASSSYASTPSSGFNNPVSFLHPFYMPNPSTPNR